MVTGVGRGRSAIFFQKVPANRPVVTLGVFVDSGGTSAIQATKCLQSINFKKTAYVLEGSEGLGGDSCLGIAAVETVGD